MLFLIRVGARLSPWAIKYPVAKQFIKFCLVGLSNFAIDFLGYWLLTRFLGFYYILAAILSFAVAVSWSFYFNQKWTFHYQGQDIYKKYLKFFIVNIVALVLNLFLLYVFVDLLKIFDLVAKLIAAVLVAFLNFGFNKFWTFK